MPVSVAAARAALLEGLNTQQRHALTSSARRLLVVAGAGSGKTEVMARRVLWWVVVEGAPRESIVAFTFTEAAAEELKFRIRQWMQNLALEGEDPTLGGMYVGTIHSFCLKMLRDLEPETYYDYEIIDDLARISLVERGYHNLLGLTALQGSSGHFDTISEFLLSWDLLNEYDLLDVQLPASPIPNDVGRERDWCKEATMLTDVGAERRPQAFATSAARLYAYMRARRLLDFSTSQSELTRLLRRRPELLNQLRQTWTRIVVDEVQDINPVQATLIDYLVGPNNHLTAVGDHRQAIYSFRGGRVGIMAGLHAEFRKAADAAIVDLPSNYRSTPPIIQLANAWASTIGAVGGMQNPDMKHGRSTRLALAPSHLAIKEFPNRQAEAAWIAETITHLVQPSAGLGAAHDDRDGIRGLGYRDVAILVRSATDVRTYQTALQNAGVPVVVRAGPDLFAQPEVLLFISCLAAAVGISRYMGRAISQRIQSSLGSDLTPDSVLRAACALLRQRGLPLDTDVEDRLLLLARALRFRLENDGPLPERVSSLRCRDAVAWIARPRKPRRVFPQTVFHWFLIEAGVRHWDSEDVGPSAMFHLGQLSRLVKGIETPGWTTSSDFKFQVIALVNWGAADARTEEAPLLASPDAVTLTTIHSAKGLEFAAVFVADVISRRFPSQFARRQPKVAFEGPILRTIDLSDIADNENYDGERRLMYVALTRAERYLFITSSNRSKFAQTLSRFIPDAGGVVNPDPIELTQSLTYHPTRVRRDERLVTSFSDLRYFLECPHDFFLRKVLGFTPSIDQAFGYGKAVHNLLRQIHSDPARWAELAQDQDRLRQAIFELVNSGSFYLRYTTGDPLDNMRRTAARGLIDYVQRYASELATLEFEPEREFETLVPNENVLVSGTIDLVRLDDPPRVTIIDFKSGEKGDDHSSGLSEELMRLQIGLYGLAARQELEYDPNRGLVRYIGESDPTRKEMVVDMSAPQLAATRETVVLAARDIKERAFYRGPTNLAPQRCGACDFAGICGQAQPVRRQ